MPRAHSARSAGRRKPHGVALVAVLWIVAALTVMVASLSAAVRTELATASALRSALQGRAMGEAAIYLVLQQLAVSSPLPTSLGVTEVRFQGHALPVEVLPQDGLIDLNQAPDTLLAATYQLLGQADPAAARQLAEATIQWRTRRDAVGQPVGLEAPEDVLQVPGFPYGVYASISRFVGTSRQGAGKVNAMAAPFEVLLVLAGGNASVAQRIAQARSRGAVGIDTTQLNQQFLGPPAGRTFRLTTLVPAGDGKKVRVAMAVELQAPPLHETPWRILHTEHQLVSP